MSQSVYDAMQRNQGGAECGDACVLALEVLRLRQLLEHMEKLPAQRFDRNQVNAELQAVELALPYNHKVEARTALVLACEVRSLRAQYVLARTCPEHNISLHVLPDGAFACWHCVEAARYERALAELGRREGGS